MWQKSRGVDDVMHFIFFVVEDCWTSGYSLFTMHFSFAPHYRNKSRTTHLLSRVHFPLFSCVFMSQVSVESTFGHAVVLDVEARLGPAYTVATRPVTDVKTACSDARTVLVATTTSATSGLTKLFFPILLCPHAAAHNDVDAVWLEESRHAALRYAAAVSFIAFVDLGGNVSYYEIQFH